MLPDDPEAWLEIEDWVAAAKVTNAMFHNRMGAIWYYLSGMLAIYIDITLQMATFGGNREIIEVDELSALPQAKRSSLLSIDSCD